MAFIDIGGTPAEENCAQIGRTPDFAKLNRLECRAYIAALERKYGKAPEGSRFSVHGNSHDYGTYYEVRFVYSDGDQVAAEYGFKAEEGLGLWEEVNFWPPVTYDDHGQPLNIIHDVELLDRERNPQCLTGASETASAPS